MDVTQITLDENELPKSALRADRGSGRTDRGYKTVDIEITRGVRYGKNRKYPMGEDQEQEGQGSTGRAQPCDVQATRSGTALLICGYKETADKAI
jgi:hypothetical protein